MQDSYGLAAFRSRQQVLMFEAALQRMGIPARVVSTPREISMGCGLSAQFPLARMEDVRRALRLQRPGAFMGLYRASYTGGRLSLTPVSLN